MTEANNKNISEENYNVWYNEIVTNFKSFAKPINIKFKEQGAKEGKDKSKITFSVVSINDCNHTDIFKNKLFFIKKEIFDKLTNTLKCITIAEKIDFLKFVKLNLQEFDFYTIKKDTNDQYSYQTFRYCKYIDIDNGQIWDAIRDYCDYKGLFKDGEREEEDIFWEIGSIITNLLRNIEKFNIVWVETIQEIKDDIQELINNYKKVNLIEPDIIPDERNLKLKTKLNISQLSFLFRTLYEYKLVDDSNKKALARFIAANFLADEDNKSKIVNLEQRIEYIYNQFTDFNKNSVNFWDEKYLNFRQYTQKLLKDLL